MKQEPIYFASPVPHFFDDPAFYTEFKHFHYCWKHIPTGENGEREIWCRNRNNFLELLIYWNRDERWEYREI
jgi:hypothetical protein